MKCIHFFAVLLVLLSCPLAADEGNLSNRSWVEKNVNNLSSLQYPERIKHLYQEHGNQLIWLDVPLMEKLEHQLEVIHRAGFSPLFSLRLNKLRKFREQRAWFEYDLFATDTLIMYLSYAEQAEKIGQEWFFDGQKLTDHLPLPSDNAFISLEVAISTQGIGELIQSYTPRAVSYQPLVKAYQTLLPLESAFIPTYFQKGMLIKPGDKLADRELLIKRLSLVNIDMSSVNEGVSWYDESLVNVVKQFQTMHGLKSDGIIGPATFKWLNLSVKARLSLLALNAERSRLWSQEDTVIVVNIPGFDMKYWYSGKPIFTTKVVVGSVKRPTPLMSVKLDSVILNPTWNVPRKIMVEDILPLAKRDVNYFSRHHIDIIKSWGSDQTLDPKVIDWSMVEPESFPYRMRQQSGRKNALGLYKFNTPNSRAIYLHDTPSKHLFNNSSRAFSSGCIRVQNASLFASKIFETQGIDESQLEESKKASNKSVTLKKRIPVQIIYQTVWYEGGSLQYRDDVYRFDAQSRG
ncbi:L,D-transpeptidase family protein [Vibrio ziniensis]|uniref:L,D-transpeptidase family protein n=1 Tax=Vibrio ziniensis TaxID=2711221 RepID=A0A6G7CIU4_9VIBR|nr:L,D-transpeptidase family protein [Vibrio ziniensis]QIH41968.1 L,D-transpeptidase family protein [Vibrio ziniensis]